MSLPPCLSKKLDDLETQLKSPAAQGKHSNQQPSAKRTALPVSNPLHRVVIVSNPPLSRGATNDIINSPDEGKRRRLREQVAITIAKAKARNEDILRQAEVEASVFRTATTTAPSTALVSGTRGGKRRQRTLSLPRAMTSLLREVTRPWHEPVDEQASPSSLAAEDSKRVKRALNLKDVDEEEEGEDEKREEENRSLRANRQTRDRELAEMRESGAGKERGGNNNGGRGGVRGKPRITPHSVEKCVEEVRRVREDMAVLRTKHHSVRHTHYEAVKEMEYSLKETSKALHKKASEIATAQHDLADHDGYDD